MAPLPPSPSPSLPPAALSIYELARLNCRERLLVPPIQWTGRHVELLQFSFEEPCPAPRSEKSGFPITGYQHAKTLFTFSGPGWREGTIEDILAEPECPLESRTGLKFYFNRRLVSILPCLTFHVRGDNPVRGPVAAYIDRVHIEKLRMDYAWARQPRRPSSPSRALCKFRARRLKPPVPHRDPYIVAMLIAVAVNQRNALPQKRSEDCLDPSSTFLAQVLLTDGNDKENIHLFSTDIASSFLDKIDHPSLRPPPSVTPTIVIRHTLVPYRPLKTFRKRLLLLLLPTLRDYDCEAIEPPPTKSLRDIPCSGQKDIENEGDLF
ncbi:hypothetical protein ACJ73_09585 [Blastomyces percursus]|uniref:Uncharacterized protein n=1 Tax=Blastomyces percursus TaxID=1658174 RepID=A0A1J9P5Q8_9EURO|nr:hypothetical protein ACJ73_09585 [Blastomyces percursus]